MNEQGIRHEESEGEEEVDIPDEFSDEVFDEGKLILYYSLQTEYT